MDFHGLSIIPAAETLYYYTYTVYSWTIWWFGCQRLQPPTTNIFYHEHVYSMYDDTILYCQSVKVKYMNSKLSDGEHADDEIETMLVSRLWYNIIENQWLGMTCNFVVVRVGSQWMHVICKKDKFESESHTCSRITSLNQSAMLLEGL